MAVGTVSAQTSDKRVKTNLFVWEPPTIDWPDSPSPATIQMEMIVALKVADFPIILEKTELEAAQRRFGGTIGSRGDAGDAEGWLCLYGRSAKGRWMLWLTSTEMNGPSIGGFQWRRLSPNESPDRRCSTIPKGSGIKLPIALHLGMSEQEVRRILGRPTFVRGKVLIYCHDHSQLIDGATYDASNNVALVLRNGAVWVIKASKTTSN
jgi:hypothetical protein